MYHRIRVSVRVGLLFVKQGRFIIVQCMITLLSLRGSLGVSSLEGSGGAAAL